MTFFFHLWGRYVFTSYSWRSRLEKRFEFRAHVVSNCCMKFVMTCERFLTGFAMVLIYQQSVFYSSTWKFDIKILHSFTCVFVVTLPASFLYYLLILIQSLICLWSYNLLYLKEELRLIYVAYLDFFVGSKFRSCYIICSINIGKIFWWFSLGKHSSGASAFFVKIYDLYFFPCFSFFFFSQFIAWNDALPAYKGFAWKLLLNICLWWLFMPSLLVCCPIPLFIWILL